LIISELTILIFQLGDVIFSASLTRPEMKEASIPITFRQPRDSLALLPHNFFSVIQLHNSLHHFNFRMRRSPSPRGV